MFKLLLSCVAVVGVSGCDASTAVKCINAGPINTMELCKSFQAALSCLANYDCIDQCKEGMSVYSNITGNLTCAYHCNPAGCFPGVGKVELEGGKTKTIAEVRVGDKVRVGPQEFSEVYFFSTLLPETKSNNVKLATDYATISLTGNHFVYTNGKLALARDVKVGDLLTLANGTKAAVVAVSSEWAEVL